MKIKKVLAGMMMCLAMASCIQDEALNVEAAIDGCRGKDIQQCLIDPNEFTIQLYVSKAADLSKINLLFELPAGATVAPEQKLQADGTDTYSFEESKTRNFKVTSEDGAFSTTYKVTLWQTEMPTTYGFETLSSLASTPYHVFYEEKDEEHILRRLEWASGNPGYQLTAQAKTPLDYPTVQVNGGMNGTKCVKLETKDTGSFGAMVKMYIAAGNLFIGSFEVGQALNDAMKATRFGFPYFYKPKSLKGYYKYKAGPQFSVKGEIVANRKDQCDIYGVLYETDDNVQFLDGSNSLDSKNIVALARDLDQLKETDEWTEFNFDFEPQNNKTIDSEKLEKGIYKLAIVFSSSVDGAKFEGAVGSTLYIDQVEIVNE